MPEPTSPPLADLHAAMTASQARADDDARAFLAALPPNTAVVIQHDAGRDAYVRVGDGPAVQVALKVVDRRAVKS